LERERSPYPKRSFLLEMRKGEEILLSAEEEKKTLPVEKRLRRRWLEGKERGPKKGG